EIACIGRPFSSECVDLLSERDDAIDFSKLANTVSGLPYEVPDSRVVESKTLGGVDGVAFQPFVCDFTFHMYYVSSLVEEPRIESAEFRDFFDGHPGLES